MSGPNSATALSLLACGLFGCGAGAGNARDTGSTQPTRSSAEELQEQFEREAEPIQKQPVEVEGAWSAYLESEQKPSVERHDDFVMVVAELGWESELTCLVYDVAIDPGAAANAMIEAAAEKVEFKQLATYHVDHDGIDPIIGIRGIYQVDQGETLAAGDYKLMVMPRAEYPVMCVHDAPGYAESFARATADFAKSFKFQSKSPRPMRGELWWSVLEGVPVGFSQRKTYKSPDGEIRRVLFSAAFIPTAPGELAFHDRVSVVTSDPDGAVMAAKYLASENGESSHAIDIEKTQRKYDYVGTVQGKEVRGSFQPKKALRGEYALERQLRQLSGKKKKASFEQWEYSPEIDPAAASKVTYEVSPENDLMVVVAKMGDRAVTMRADARGILRQVVFPIGGRTVEIRLVEEVGEL